MSLDSEFQAALAHSKSLPGQPPNIQLKLYGLFKQATQGDVQGKRPGRLELRGRAKYDAWTKRSGQTRDEAKQAYIQAISAL